MKNNNPTLHDKEELNKLPKSGNDAVDRCLKIGLDIELRRVAVAVQSGARPDWAGPQADARATNRLGEKEGGRGLPGLHGL